MLDRNPRLVYYILFFLIYYFSYDAFAAVDYWEKEFKILFKIQKN